MKEKKTTLTLLIFLGSFTLSFAQNKPTKIKHAEPLFVDLVRDLGARKGEKELNFAIDYKSKSKSYDYLIEYEFAPINRLGLEIEADFRAQNPPDSKKFISNNELESIRFSTQYTLFVSPKHQSSFALGYTHILEKNSSTIFSPFAVFAKNFNQNHSTLLYVNPQYSVNQKTETLINASYFYFLGSKRHFIGTEISTNIQSNKIECTFRPQLKFIINHKVSSGLVYSIKSKENSFFLRLIYEI